MSFINRFFDPIERWLDTNIENGNIWWYAVGLVVVVLYFIIF